MEPALLTPWSWASSPPELRDNTFLLFKPLRLLYFLPVSPRQLIQYAGKYFLIARKLYLNRLFLHKCHSSIHANFPLMFPFSSIRWALWKLKWNHTKESQEARGGALTGNPSPRSQEALSIIDPNRTVNRKESSAIDSTGKDARCLSCRKSAAPDSANENCRLPELSVVSNGLLFNLSQLPSFSP